MNRTERLTAILLLLQDRPHTAGQIARRFEVSRRTVLRDVQALAEMGVPVIAREGPGGGYSLPESYTLEPLALTSNEAFLLLLALNSLNQLTDAPHSAERVTLAAKLRARLPHDQLARLDPLLEKVDVPAAPRPQRAPWLDALVQALDEERWVRLDYQSSEQVSQVHCQPLRIYSQHGYWYCRAYVHEKQAERVYRVDRILRLEAPSADFRPPVVAPALPYGHPSHPNLRARLTRRGARLVEVDTDVAAQLHYHPDGSAGLDFHCPPDELEYYARYFAGLGAEVEVLGPPELCARLAALGQRLVGLYTVEK
ncbi:MAG: WYL domain-containing protein [Anaerolineaceae bacterium]|nr:WYL domain-containing protein [Anaerolineaceae bacterium]